MKRFIAPQGWFAMSYPDSWNEFEDEPGSFLFYDPDQWEGNFRISAYRDASPEFAALSMRQEQAEIASARLVQLGGRSWVFSQEEFQEDGTDYTTCFWLGGEGGTLLSASFTMERGASAAPAEQILASVEIRREGAKYPAEVIPVRLAEIACIDQAYEWVEHEVKERLKRDFQGTEEDLASMQQLVDAGCYKPKQRDAWLALGIAYCVILANEVDGWEWRTLIDGNREAPLLVHVDSGEQLDPMKVAWSKVKAGEKVQFVS